MMKQDLQRIEATLRRLNTSSTQATQSAVASATSSGQTSTRSRLAQGPSFAIAKSACTSQSDSKASASSNSTPTNSPTPTAGIQPPPRARKPISATPPTVQPFPAQQSAAQPLSLPKFKLPSFSNHRHSFNSGLPLSLAKEIGLTVERWQAELRQVITQIQVLYAEGPIVNGWLEQEKEAATGSTQVDLDTAILRHGEGDELLRYVEKICESTSSAESADSENTVDVNTGVNNTDKSGAPAAGSATHAAQSTVQLDGRYQLCGLDSDGRLWCRPCPPDQIPTVSMAIARYRKLRVLLNRKEQLEVRLRHAAEALVEVQSYLQRMVQPT